MNIWINVRILVYAGVAQYALLFPHSRLTWALLRDVLTLPFWQMLMATRSDTVLQAPPFDMHGAGLCTNDENLYSNYTMVRTALLAVLDCSCSSGTLVLYSYEYLLPRPSVLHFARAVLARRCAVQTGGPARS